MAYVQQDEFPFQLSQYCNVTDPHYGSLTNVSSLGELYMSKLLADPTFHMVGMKY